MTHAALLANLSHKCGITTKREQIPPATALARSVYLLVNFTDLAD